MRLAIGVALIGSPLVAILVRSLLVTGVGDAAPHLSFGDFAALLGDSRFGDSVLNSLIAGAATTVLTLVLGFTLAFLVVRTDMPGRAWLGRANTLPFFLSPYAGAVAWSFLLAPHDGLLPAYAHGMYRDLIDQLEIYSVPGVIFVMVLFHTPYVYLLLVPTLRDLDAAFEDTARVHGATFWHTLRHITLPMARPALTAAAAIVFLASVWLFDVPAALGLRRGIPFVPTEIYAMARTSTDTGLAAAFAVVVAIAALGLIAWLRRFLTAPPFAASPARPEPTRLSRLSWPARIAALALEAAYLSASVILPLIALLLVAFSRHWTGRIEWRTATTMHFEYILTTGELARAAIGNSLILAVLSATIGVVLVVPRGWSVTRRAWSARPLASGYDVPGIVFGLGFLLLAARTPLSGTLAIVVISYVAWGLPIATNLVAARSREIDPELEQIARVSGATPRQTRQYIVAPLMRRTLVASWLILFTFFIRELGAPMMLYANGNETMSVAMTLLIDRDPSAAAVLALLQMAILLLSFVLFTRTRATLTMGYSPA